MEQDKILSGSGAFFQGFGDQCIILRGQGSTDSAPGGPQ